MNIVMVSAEVSPFAKTGGLGDVLGALPKTLAARGHEVTVFTPYYRQTAEYFERTGEQPEKLEELTLTWAGWVARVTLLRTAYSGVTIIFVADDLLFDREQLYSVRSDGFDDHLERFTVFCRAVMAGCESMGLRPDVFHAHDWHAALIPIYSLSEFPHTATVYTIHNLNYQGRYGGERFLVLGVDRDLWSADGLEFYGDVNLMKGGILFADQVTTVSPTYAREIQTEEFGAGLEGVLLRAGSKLTGILNGIDVEEWDPRTDPDLIAPFDANDFTGKVRCKRDLRQIAGLRATGRGPLIGGVSRLVEQKGFDLFLPIASKAISFGAQVVILGTGDPEVEEAFRQLESNFPGDVRAFLTFDSALSHKIIAGSDLLLMPSRYEPCGLNQMYALRYGTLPVVRLTGGLADTVIPYDGTNRDAANGFGFLSPDPRDLHRELWLALLTSKDRAVWRQLQLNGMAMDFSWDASAREYERVYQKAIATHNR